MSKGPVVLVLVAMGLVFAPAALAAMEEVVLNDGRAGVAEILETTPDSVTVEFVAKTGDKVKMKLPASRLDAHCFYELRRHHMEETAENHLRLAVWCAQNGMFKRAHLQYDIAVALDPKFVEEVKNRPGLREGVAESVVEAAKKFYSAGDTEKAAEMARKVTTHWNDTPAAGQAQALLELIEESAHEAEAKAEADRREAMDEDAKKDAEKMDKDLEPARRARDLGQKFNAKGREESNQNNAKKAYEAAAAEYVKALKHVERLKEKYGDAVGNYEQGLKDDAVRSYLNAGNVALSRGSYKDARDLAGKALTVDANSSAAQSFLARIETAEAMNDTFDARYRRGSRGPGGGRR